MNTHQKLTYKTSPSLLPPLPLKCNGKKTNFSSAPFKCNGKKTNFSSPRATKKDNNQSSVHSCHNNGYSTLFTCLIAPLILCSIKIN